MSDLVKRLRDLADSAAVGKKLYAGAFVVLEAADLIEQQAARIAALEDGLRKIERSNDHPLRHNNEIQVVVESLLGGSNG